MLVRFLCLGVKPTQRACTQDLRDWKMTRYGKVPGRTEEMGESSQEVFSSTLLVVHVESCVCKGLDSHELV